MKTNTYPILEQLETRRLMSATLVDGVLKIVGTPGNDRISVCVSPDDPKHIRLYVEAHSLNDFVAFKVSAVKRVEMYGLAGNDGLNVMNDEDHLFPVAVFIKGGRGDDNLGGASHDDTLYGGDGNDIVGGAGGNDRVYGQAGDDTLVGNEGDDVIIGGDGNDHASDDSGNNTIKGGAGNDGVLGGDGNDRIYGGAGDDYVGGYDGSDFVFGGLGADHFLLGDDPAERKDFSAEDTAEDFK
ncbi:MAG TPA: calcium-binding protein [Tepidisphaeraceae bacterium]|jgi:hypothetical protein|nr:calcium-binding protein [Tepidisphaeraceae bacterium]